MGRTVTTQEIRYSAASTRPAQMTIVINITLFYYYV